MRWERLEAEGLRLRTGARGTRGQERALDVVSTARVSIASSQSTAPQPTLWAVTRSRRFVRLGGMNVRLVRIGRRQLAVDSKAEIFQAHRPRLLGVACRMLGARSPTAEDVLRMMRGCAGTPPIRPTFARAKPG